MEKEYVFIFRDYDGYVVAVNTDFDHGLQQALDAIGNQKMIDPKTGGCHPLAVVARWTEEPITYRNIDEIFDYNLTCLKWLISH